jgi:hypothetical protein
VGRQSPQSIVGCDPLALALVILNFDRHAQFVEEAGMAWVRLQ